jgi:hypothetical protein
VLGWRYIGDMRMHVSRAGQTRTTLGRDAESRTG